MACGELDSLKRKNEELMSRLGDLENQKEYYEKVVQQEKGNVRGVQEGLENDRPKYNHSDFLKCMYGQAQFIEKQFLSVQRKSYF